MLLIRVCDIWIHHKTGPRNEMVVVREADNYALERATVWDICLSGYNRLNPVSGDIFML